VVNDIDLNNVPWTPIGIKETETHGDGYNGTFDGGGWAIKNLNISSFSAPILFEVTYGYSYRECLGGLFGLVGKNGTVQYVNIDGIVTGNLSYSSDDSLTGIEIGAVAGANLGVIEECSSTCNFSNLTITNNGNMGIGGVVGFTERTATIKNCYYVGNMTMTLKSTGGIYRTNQRSILRQIPAPSSMAPSPDMPPLTQFFLIAIMTARSPRGHPMLLAAHTSGITIMTKTAAPGSIHPA
jgi:hypothetical protein